LQNAMVRPMADDNIIQFPKGEKYCPVADLTETISEYCDGLDVDVVLPALTTILIKVLAQCIKPEGHTDVVDGVAQLLREGIAVAVGDEVTRSH
jgi:hypothetical protein